MGPSRRVAASLCLVLLLALRAGAEEPLPRPAGLEPNVRFWERIYSEIDGDGGVIHDSEYLDVVYEQVHFSHGQSRRSRERDVEKAKKRIRDALLVLAKGRRTGLSAEQAEVLARWPDGISNTTLRRAAGNVRFQLGQADRFREGLIRSGAWLDHIQHTLRKYGVPTELAALPHVESSFNPKAYSRVGAAGLWQFTRSTGHLFLRIDSVVDERLDPFKATDAAARLLLKNHDITGSWPLAITAYNHGAAGMQRAARTLGTTDIATIVRKYNSRTFGFASRNFYASFMAAVAVDRNAAELFGNLQPDPRIDYTIIEMPHFYRAASLASALGVSIATLREHNNALRPAVWDGNKYVPRGYPLRVPSEALAAPSEQLLARIPDGERLAEQHRDRFHKVRRGETLSAIARVYGVRLSELVALNHLRSRHRIRVGQVLTLPGDVSTPIEVARQERPEDGVYTVRRGDTISIIARRFDVSENQLAQVNRLRNRHKIHVGQQLSIPGGAPLVVASSKTAAAPTPPPTEPAADPVLVARAEVETPKPMPLADRETSEPAPPDADETSEPAPVPLDGVETAEPELMLLTEIETHESAPAPPDADETSEPAPVPLDGVETAEPAPAPPGRAAPAGLTGAAGATADASTMPPPDPSDYAVHRGRVTVQAAETLGHYAEWLEVRASQLRARNRMRYEQPLVIGRQVDLDFSRVTPEEFERRRLEYHRTLQDEFFSAFEVTGTERHVLRRGETLWYLAERKYRVPLWLLRQYNPELDFATLPAGVSMVVPVVEPRAG